MNLIAYLRRAALAAALGLAACAEPPPPPAPPAEAPAAASKAPPRRAPAAERSAPARSVSPREPEPALRCADAGRGPEPDARGLKAYMRARQKAVRACWNRELKRNPDASGSVLVTFTLGRCGEIREVAFREDAGDVGLAARCVEKLLRAKRTAFRPREAVTVEWPLELTAE